ncbi:TPA: hypothetical protein U1160_002108 [Streptococcus suis]|nr:hypothetical protein [Streptococcus suis]HEM4926392.1 hypothetical protein [Streptococcus suis]
MKENLEKLVEIKIENCEEFRKYLKILFKKASYIHYIILDKDPYDNSLFENYFKKNGIKPKITRLWPGTMSGGNNLLYNAPLTKELKNIILSFESFFIPSYDRDGQYTPKKTSWGISDICFYDINSELLSYTTTHEGWMFANTEILKELKEFEI